MRTPFHVRHAVPLLYSAALLGLCLVAGLWYRTLTLTYPREVCTPGIGPPEVGGFTCSDQDLTAALIETSGMTLLLLGLPLALAVHLSRRRQQASTRTA